MRFLKFIIVLFLNIIRINSGIVPNPIQIAQDLELIINPIDEPIQPDSIQQNDLELETETEMIALFDYANNIVLYKDTMAETCFIERLTEEFQVDLNLNTNPVFKILLASNSERRIHRSEIEFKYHRFSRFSNRSSSMSLSEHQLDFCGTLPTFTVEQPKTDSNRLLKRVHRDRKKRNTIGTPYTMPGTGQEMVIMTRQQYEMLQEKMDPMLTGFRRQPVSDLNYEGLGSGAGIRSSGSPLGDEHEAIRISDTILSSGSRQWDSSGAWPMQPPATSSSAGGSETGFGQNTAGRASTSALPGQTHGSGSSQKSQWSHNSQSSHGHSRNRNSGSGAQAQLPSNVRFISNGHGYRQYSGSGSGSASTSFGASNGQRSHRIAQQNGAGAGAGAGLKRQSNGGVIQQNLATVMPNVGHRDRGSVIQYASRPQLEVIQQNGINGAHGGNILQQNGASTNGQSVNGYASSVVQQNRIQSQGEVSGQRSSRLTNGDQSDGQGQGSNFNNAEQADQSHAYGQLNGNRNGANGLQENNVEDLRVLDESSTRVYADYALQGQGQEIRLPQSNNGQGGPQYQYQPQSDLTNSNGHGQQGSNAAQLKGNLASSNFGPQMDSNSNARQFFSTTQAPEVAGNGNGYISTLAPNPNPNPLTDKSKCCIVTFTCVINPAQQMKYCRPKVVNNSNGGQQQGSLSGRSNGIGNGNGNNGNRNQICCKC